MVFLAALVLAAPAGLAPGHAASPEAAPAAGGAAPYVVITKDGHRIDAMEKPVVEAKTARLRLAPRGTPAFYPADRIDWEATEKYNAAAPPPAAKPAPEPPPPPAAEPGRVIEMRIVGGAKPTASTAPAEPRAGEGGAPGSGAASAAPGGAADPNAAADLLAALNREMANLRKLQADFLATRSRLEKQISDLEAKVANEPASSQEQNYEAPSRKALERARSEMSSVNERLAGIEARMNEMRFKAVEAGGVLD